MFCSVSIDSLFGKSSLEFQNVTQVGGCGDIDLLLVISCTLEKKNILISKICK